MPTVGQIYICSRTTYNADVIRSFKCLTLYHEWIVEGLAIKLDGRIRSPGVLEVLPRPISARGDRSGPCWQKWRHRMVQRQQRMLSSGVAPVSG